MVSPNVNKVLEEVKSLTLDERRQLLQLLDEMSGKVSVPTEDEKVEQSLLRKGMTSAIPPRNMSSAEYRAWEPIQVKGKPVSQSLIEDRR